MAKPVEFRRFTPQNSRGDLIRWLEEAPEDHAEALLLPLRSATKASRKGLD